MRKLHLSNPQDVVTISTPTTPKAGRKLRLLGEDQVQDAKIMTNRKVTVGVVDPKVDELLELETTVKAEQDKLDAILKDKVERAVLLKKELMETAKEKDVTRIEGQVGVFVVKPGSKGEIDAKGLATWLKGIGQGARIWEFLTVGITKVKAAYGESVLESAGVLDIHTEKFSRCEVRRK